MRRRLCIVGALIFSVTTTNAQELITTNSSVKKVGDSVVVRFDTELDKLPPNYRIVVIPKLYNKKDTVTMRSIIFARRIQRIYDGREAHGYGDAILVGKSSKITYEQTIPFEGWMANSNLSLDKYFGVCGKETLGSMLLSRGNLTPVTPVIETPSFSNYTQELLAAERKAVASKFAFVHPINEYRDFNLEQDNYRTGGVTIYFSVGSNFIDKAFKDNISALNRIKTAINYIAANPNLELKRVAIIGATSVEGTYAFNMRLSERRAASLINYLRDELDIIDPDMFISRSLGEDWIGLRYMVQESTMPYKREVLDIIHNYTIFQGREKRLMDLKGGDPYRYMKRHFFPELRSASYVQVFYDIVDDELAGQMEAITSMVEAKEYSAALIQLKGMHTNAFVDNLMGLCYMMLGDVENARHYLQQAIKGGSKDAKENLEKLDEQQSKITYL